MLSYPIRTALVAVALGLAGTAPLTAQGHAGHGAHAAATDSAAVAAVVDAYHQALAAGDTAAALALLAPDVVVLEGGGMETREEYVSHHLPADIAFAQAVPRERGPIHVAISGNTAWAASTSTARGTYRGRAIDSQGAELMVLVRDGESWRITAIHWSSRNVGS